MCRVMERGFAFTMKLEELKDLICTLQRWQMVAALAQPSHVSLLESAIQSLVALHLVIQQDQRKLSRVPPPMQQP